MEYEIIVVDDGSTDGTVEVARSQEGVRLIQHHTNRGYGAAIKTGIRLARYDCVAIIDADGTYPPEALPGLLEVTDEYDMVVGARPSGDIPASTLKTIGSINQRDTPGPSSAFAPESSASCLASSSSRWEGS